MLAVVGKRTVTARQLLDRLAQFKKRVGNVTTTGQQLRQLLAGIVDEELLIAEAWRRGWGDDAAAKAEKQRLEMQEMLDWYHKKFVRPQVRISDAELQRLFVRFNTKVKARHLYAGSKHVADSLYQLLQNGADFAQLASTVFRNPELRRSGGSVGYFTVDEMDPFFEDAAYALPVGEISKPVKTAAGYSIIQVENKIGNPVLTKTLFNERKQHLYRYWFDHKMQRLSRKHADSIAAALDIRFDENTLHRLFAAIHKNESEKELLKSQGKDIFNVPMNGGAKLVESRHNVLTVFDFQQKARFTSAKQRGWIRSLFTLREYISGLLIRDAMLQKVRQAGYAGTKEAKAAVHEKLETWLLTRMENEIDAGLLVSEDSLRAYFAEDPSRFAVAPQFALNEIVVLKQETADSIKAGLESGEDFDLLRKLYSIYPDPKKKTGFYPFYSADDFGGLALDLAALKIGDYLGPVSIEEKFAFFRCEGRRPGKMRSFAEARAEVERTVRYMQRDRNRKKAVDAIRKKSTVKVYYEKIKSLRLK